MRIRTVAWVILAGGALLVAPAAPARAQDDLPDSPPGAAETLDAEADTGDTSAQPEDGFTQRHRLQVRVNPIGLSLLSDFAYRIHPYAGDSLLTQRTYLDLGLTTRVSPSFLWIGPYLEAVPIAFLRLRASFTPVLYFGTFGFLFDGFESRDARWDEDELDRIDDEGLGESAFGWQVYVEATLQMKAGPIVAILENSYTYQWIDVDGALIYEPYADFLLERNDGVWAMRGTLGAFIGPDPANWYLIVGPRYDRSRSRETDFTRQQVGGLILWQVPRTWIEWGRPQVVVLVQHYLEHPMRDGEMIGAGQIQLTF